MKSLPLSTKSDLVNAQIVLSPFLSYFYANLIASEVDISILAYTAHKIIVLGSLI